MRHPAAPRDPIFGPVCFGPLFAAPAVAGAAAAASSSAAAAAATATTIAAAVSAATAVAGLGISALGSIRAQQAASANAAYQRKVASNNELLANLAVQRQDDLGDIAVGNRSAQTRALIGTQRATFAANGVLVDSGSALDTVGDTAALGKLDELTIKDNSDQRAAALRAQGANFKAESEFSDSGPGFDYGGALSNVGQVASKWYDFGNQQGWFTPSAPSGGGYSGAELAGTGSSY